MNTSDIFLVIIEWLSNPWVDLGARFLLPFSVRTTVLAVHLAWYAIMNVHRAVPRCLEPPQVAELDREGIWQQWIDSVLEQETQCHV